MQKENKNQLTSSRSAGMRDINALLQTASISRIKTLRDDEGRRRNAGQALPDNKTKCHSKLDLESHRMLLRNEEILNQVQDDRKRAFTLIELLVVILIIGILAAIALPQYQLAVHKSRFIKYRAMAGSLVKAVYLYYDEHGDWPRNFTSLDIELPAEMLANSASTLNGTCGVGTDMYCCITYPVKLSSDGGIICGDLDYSFASSVSFADHATKQALRSNSCVEKNSLHLNVCKSLQGRILSDSTSLIAPNGARSGYSTYAIP